MPHPLTDNLSQGMMSSRIPHSTITLQTIAVTLLGVAAAVVQANPDVGDRHLILRYDDYAPISVQTGQPRNVEIDQRLFGLAAHYETSILVGVVPFPIAAGTPVELDPELADPNRSWLADPLNAWTALLRDSVQSGTVEVALHGFEHRRSTPDGHRPGEFNARPYFWQYDAISSGNAAIRQALGHPATTFIPPWNAWNDDTAHSLFIAGFTHLSPDLHVRPQQQTPLHVLPQSTADPQAALDWMSNDRAPTGTVLVLVIHPFDLEGANGSEYSAALDRVLAFAARSAEWRCARIADLPSEPMDASAARYDRAVAFEHSRRLVHDSVAGSLVPLEHTTMYFPAGWYAHRMTLSRAAVLAIVGIPGVVAALAAGFLARRFALGRRGTVVAAVMATAVAALLIYGAAVVEQQGYLVRGVRWQAMAIAAAIGVILWVRAAMQLKRIPQRQVVADMATAAPTAESTPLTGPLISSTALSR